MVHTRYALAAVGIALGLFLGILLFIELGRRLGIRRNAQQGTEAKSGVSVGDSVVYALLALLIGFAFNGAAARFDARRHLVLDEVNATRTAWERIEALPANLQEPVRADFRRYLDVVLSQYNASSTEEARRTASVVTRAQSDLWSRATAACLTADGEKARMLLLPSLNVAFDAVETERLARLIHPPMVIFLLLTIAAFAGALFLGYSTASTPTRSWLHIIGVAATISLAAFVIIELEYPRLGLIRVDATDQALVDLRATMNEPG